MWRVVAVALLSSCGGPECEPPAFVCGDEFAQACGNDRIDACEGDPVEGACYSLDTSWEICDGAISCADGGYYDGTATCIECRRVDTTPCRACPLDAAGCGIHPGQFGARKLVANGMRVLAIGKKHGMDDFALLDGTTFVAKLGTRSRRTDAVAVPDGFLLVDGGDLVPLALDGTPGAIQTLPPPAGGAALAYGPNGGALVAWRGQYDIYTAIVDTAGVLVTPAQRVAYGHASHGIAVATDGTQYYVAHAGQLSRIAADNTLLGVTSGFPMEEPYSNSPVTIEVIWDGIAGWYLGRTHIQRFTADGELAGSALEMRILDAARGDNKLLVLTHVEPELVVVTLSSLTSERTITPIGAGWPAGAIVQIDDQLLGMWDLAETRLALVAAP